MNALRTQPRADHARRLCRALGMVEAVVSTLIVGVMLVAALNAVGASRTGARTLGNRARGALLAQELMAEIMQLPYEDPDGLPVFGSEEILTLGNRSAFDDVDDYHGWSEAPPTAKDGALLAGDQGWERSVSVAYVNPDDLNSTSITDTGVKRITVTASFQGRMVTQRVAIRSGAGGLGLDISIIGG